MSGRPLDHIRLHSVALHLSREMAVEYGLVEPTPQEQADRDRLTRQYEERKRARDHAQVAMLAALTAKTDAPTVAVLALHQAEPHPYGDPTCTECYDGGDMSDHADWPCETVFVLAEAHGIPTEEARR